MSQDQKKGEKLESQASQLIDQSAADEETLDRAAEILAEAEKLKGPIDKAGTGTTKAEKPKAK